MADGARLLYEDIHKEYAERNCENLRFVREHFEKRHAQKDDGERDQEIDGNGAVHEHFVEPIGVLVSACAVQAPCQERICISAAGAEKIGVAENIRTVNFCRRGGPGKQLGKGVCHKLGEGISRARNAGGNTNGENPLCRLPKAARIFGAADAKL